jgi:hypothetical protein
MNTEQDDVPVRNILLPLALFGCIFGAFALGGIGYIVEWIACGLLCIVVFYLDLIAQLLSAKKSKPENKPVIEPNPIPEGDEEPVFVPRATQIYPDMEL